MYIYQLPMMNVIIVYYKYGVIKTKVKIKELLEFSVNINK